MPKYQLTQSLTEWPGDTPALIAEMKRRAGVRTDRDLATFMGVAQSTVSHWRTRDRVPEATVLRCEKLILGVGAERDSSRVLAARMVAFRLAEFWWSSLPGDEMPARRFVVFGTVAMVLHRITDEIYEHLVRFERETGLGDWEVASLMMDDERFLTQVRHWVGSIPMGQGLMREAMSPPTVRLRATMEFPNQVSQSGKGRKKPRKISSGD